MFCTQYSSLTDMITCVTLSVFRGLCGQLPDGQQRLNASVCTLFRKLQDYSGWASIDEDD